VIHRPDFMWIARWYYEGLFKLTILTQTDADLDDPIATNLLIASSNIRPDSCLERVRDNLSQYQLDVPGDIKKGSGIILTNRFDRNKRYLLSSAIVEKSRVWSVKS